MKFAGFHKAAGRHHAVPDKEVCPPGGQPHKASPLELCLNLPYLLKSEMQTFSCIEIFLNIFYFQVLYLPLNRIL